MIALSLLDLRAPLLIEVGKKLKECGQKVCYFTNQKIDNLNKNELVLILTELPIQKKYPLFKERFRHIYFNDRSFKYYHTEEQAIKIFSYWLDASIKYIEKNEIKFALIEGTPAYELIFEIACEIKSVKIINVFHAPGPRGWSLISSSSVEINLYKSKKFKNSYLSALKNNASKRKVYVDINESIFEKLIRFIKRPRNHNYYPKHVIIADIILRPISYLLSYILVVFKGTQENNVLYLHQEPERTVSNCGSIFSNQIEAIRYITKKLKLKVTLKEHPDWLGKRQLKFLFYVLFNKDVSYIITQKRDVELAWTFSGSIAWENELISKPTILLGGTYLKHAKHVHPIFIDERNVYKYNNFFDFISEHVFPCELCGVNLTSEALSNKNINNLSKAILVCLTSSQHQF